MSDHRPYDDHVQVTLEGTGECLWIDPNRIVMLSPNGCRNGGDTFSQNIARNACAASVGSTTKLSLSEAAKDFALTSWLDTLIGRILCQRSTDGFVQVVSEHGMWIDCGMCERFRQNEHKWSRPVQPEWPGIAHKLAIMWKLIFRMQDVEVKESIVKELEQMMLFPWFNAGQNAELNCSGEIIATGLTDNLRRDLRVFHDEYPYWKGKKGTDSLVGKVVRLKPEHMTEKIMAILENGNFDFTIESWNSSTFKVYVTFKAFAWVDPASCTLLPEIASLMTASAHVLNNDRIQAHIISMDDKEKGDEAIKVVRKLKIGLAGLDEKIHALALRSLALCGNICREYNAEIRQSYDGMSGLDRVRLL